MIRRRAVDHGGLGHSHVHHMVRGPDGLLVALHHDDGVAEIAVLGQVPSRRRRSRTIRPSAGQIGPDPEPVHRGLNVVLFV